MKRPEKDDKYIPPGLHCYTSIGSKDKGGRWILSCPYRELVKDKPQQESGYCHYIESGDWEEPGSGLVWDGCKECGIKNEEETLHWEDGGDQRKYLEQTIDWATEVIPLIENNEEHKKVAEKWLEKLKKEKNGLP